MLSSDKLGSKLLCCVQVVSELPLLLLLSCNIEQHCLDADSVRQHRLQCGFPLCSGMSASWLCVMYIGQSRIQCTEGQSKVLYTARSCCPLHGGKPHCIPNSFDSKQTYRTFLFTVHTYNHVSVRVICTHVGTNWGRRCDHSLRCRAADPGTPDCRGNWELDERGQEKVIWLCLACWQFVN